MSVRNFEIVLSNVTIIKYALFHFLFLDEHDSRKTIYTHTVDGANLKSINISELLKAGKVDLKLKR